MADAYGRYLDLALGDPGVEALLTWGITDRYTWLNHEGARTDRLPERALPFDTAYQPKSAFGAMKVAIERRGGGVTRG